MCSEQRRSIMERIAVPVVVVFAGLATMANMAGPPPEYYEQEIISGDQIIVFVSSDEPGTLCYPAFDVNPPAALVELHNSSGKRIASMSCDDGTDCIERVSSLQTCKANGPDHGDEEDASGPDGGSSPVTCDLDLPVLSSRYQNRGPIGSDPVIKECVDEFTVTVEYTDGGTAETTYRQLYHYDQMGDYTCEYPY